jgi:repressor LexA
MKNRLRELRQERNLKQGELSARLGVAQSTLSAWELGKFDIDSDSLRRLSEIFDVSVDYLIYNDNVRRRQTVTNFGNILPITTKKVPLLGEIACGKPIYANEEFGEFADVYDDLRCDFCLRAKGESMVGAGIKDGDIVFCRQSEMVENGRIAVIGIEDEATLKRFYYFPDQDRVILAAENPAFPPMIYEGQAISGIRVLGEAVAYQSRIK